MHVVAMYYLKVLLFKNLRPRELKLPKKGEGVQDFYQSLNKLGNPSIKKVAMSE